jgi:hypothetical protein
MIDYNFKIWIYELSDERKRYILNDLLRCGYIGLKDYEHKLEILNDLVYLKIDRPRNVNSWSIFQDVYQYYSVQQARKQFMEGDYKEVKSEIFDRQLKLRLLNEL